MRSIVTRPQRSTRRRGTSLARFALLLTSACESTQPTSRLQIGIFYHPRLHFLLVCVHIRADNENIRVSIRCICVPVGAMRYPPHLSSGRVFTLAALLVLGMSVGAMAHQSSHSACGLPSVTGLATGHEVVGESRTGQKCPDIPQEGCDPADSSAASAFHLPRSKLTRSQCRFTGRCMQRFVRPTADAALPMGMLQTVALFRTSSFVLAGFASSALQNCISLHRFLL
jgi:hypothetical protein